jgi:hypothetical protein
MNLTSGEPLSLLNKFPCFDNPIELDVLLASSLNLGVHDLINHRLLNAFKIEFLGAKCSTTCEVSRRGGKYGRGSSTLNTR